MIAFGSAADIARIENIMRNGFLVSGQYARKVLAFTAPAPLTDMPEKYFASYRAGGALSAQGTKALGANIGSLAGKNERHGGQRGSSGGTAVGFREEQRLGTR